MCKRLIYEAVELDTAAAEMRAAYKVGFKDGVALMREVQR